MSISGTSNYMSNASILEWMQLKTESLYGKMSDAMDASNSRSDAEDKLNEVKGMLSDLKTNGGDCENVRVKINDTLANFKDVPEVAEVLQQMADNLNGQNDSKVENQAKVDSLTQALAADPTNSDLQDQLDQAKIGAGQVEIKAETVDNWTDDIKNKVSTLSEQDQLGMVNIQEFNAQLNEAKQTASALMDAADKSANAIINHIG